MRILWRHLVVAATALALTAYHVRSFSGRNAAQLLRSDAATYYAYLPAGLIHGNWARNSQDRLPATEVPTVAELRGDDGSVVIKMTMGLAMMQAPFFLVGHAVASLSDCWPADGYSRPYMVALVAGSLAYFICGLWLLSRLLARFFDDRVVALTVLLMAWATNATYYLLQEPAMSHGYSFCLFATFVWLSMDWYRRPAMSSTILLGLIGGLITLVRPTNGVIVLVFLLWNVRSFDDLKHHGMLYWKHCGWFLLGGAAAMLVWVPQLLYWKQATGCWLYYSYGDENFFFLRPKLFDVVVGFRKGWLVYTPAMILAIAGFPCLYRFNRGLFWNSLSFLLVNVYVVASWWCWWYGGSYGQRALIESYAVMALPMAALIQWAWAQGVRGVVAVLGLAGVLVIHNGFQLLQLRSGALHMENMTRSAYMEAWGKRLPTPAYEACLRRPDFAAARLGLAEREWSGQP